MTPIEQVTQIAVDFLKRVLRASEVRVLRVGKSDGGWMIETEAYEESAFIKALGLPSRVQDRNLYRVKLNSQLEVEAYEREDALASAG